MSLFIVIDGLTCGEQAAAPGGESAVDGDALAKRVGLRGASAIGFNASARPYATP